jgi:hypothetical protein
MSTYWSLVRDRRPGEPTVGGAGRDAVLVCGPL